MRLSRRELVEWWADAERAWRAHLERHLPRAICAMALDRLHAREAT